VCGKQVFAVTVWTVSGVRSDCWSLPSSALGGSVSRVPHGLAAVPQRSPHSRVRLFAVPSRNRNMPSRLTLAQIEDMLARDEVQLEAYRCAAAEAAAENLDPGHAFGLAKFVEERIDLLRRARALRLAR